MHKLHTNLFDAGYKRSFCDNVFDMLKCYSGLNASPYNIEMIANKIETDECRLDPQHIRYIVANSVYPEFDYE